MEKIQKDIEILLGRMNLARYLILNNYVQRDDLINDIYCHVFSKNLNKVNYNIIKNLLINKYFRKKELNNEDLDEYEEIIEDKRTLNIESKILAKDILKFIKPYDKFNIVYEYHILGKTFKEIGDKNKVSKQFVNQEYHKLINKIKNKYC